MEIEFDPDKEVTNLAKHAGPDTVTFVSDRKYLARASETKAEALQHRELPLI